MVWIIISLFIFIWSFIALIVIGLCKAASIADIRAEEIMEDLMINGNNRRGIKDEA